MAAVRVEAKAAGVMDTPELLWQFFISKVWWLYGVLCRNRCNHCVLTILWRTKYKNSEDNGFWWVMQCLQVKKNLRVVLCCSPVGDRFRTWARQFPALINCTVTNTFSECGQHI